MIQQTDPSTILLAKAVGAAWWIWDVANNNFSFDSELSKILGVTKDIDTANDPLELLLKNCHSEDVDIVRNSIRISANKNSELDFEFRVMKSSGFKYIRCLASPIIESGSKARELMGYVYEDKSRRLEEKIDALENVMFHIPGQVFWKDRDLTYLGCNKGFADTVGLSHPKEVVGKTDFDFQRSSEHAQMYRDDDIRIMNSGQADLEIEEPYHCSDGSEGFVLTSKVPLINGKEKVFGILGICRDITTRVKSEKTVLEQKQMLEQQAEQLDEVNKRYNQALEEQKQMFEELVDIIPVMINSFDAEGNCLIWNKSCEKILGYSFEDAQTDSRLMEKFYPDTDLHEQVLKEISNPDGQFREYPVVVKGGGIRTQLWSNFLLKNNSMIGCGIDISELKDVENTLALEKQRFRSVIDNMPMGYHLWELDQQEDLVFRDYNNAADNILGLDHTIFENKIIEEAFPSLDGTNLPDKCKEIAKHGGTFEHEALNYKDDKIDSVFSSVYFQCYPGATVSIFRDISDIRRKEIELNDTYKKLKLVMEGSQDGFWHWLNPEQDRVEWSDNFFRLLGFSPQEFIPSFSRFQTMLHPEDLNLTLTAVQKAIKDKETFDIQYRIENKAGKYQWFRGRGTPYYNEDGGFKEMAGSISDINQIKKLENQLKEINQELEQFAYIASHDLKEPVRTLRTFSNYLIEDLQSNNDKRIAEDVKYINSASGRMTKLIDDLLEFSKAGNLPLKKSKLSLSDIVDTVKENLQTQINDSSAIIKTEIQSDSVSGDSSLFGLVIQNLLQNAIKFQPRGQQPEITITSITDSSSNNVEINVIDNGIGIDPHQLESIFGVFKKLHASSEFEGTGIGLAIVHKIVKRHGGVIEVVSTSGKGSCFKISLPILK